MKITLVDIKYSYREVDVPLECPDCSSDLTKKNSVWSWVYQDQKELGAIHVPAGISPNITGTEEERKAIHEMEGALLGEEEEEGFVPDVDGGLEGGESYIGALALVCACCSKLLVSGEETEVTNG